jgi:hypothetical protein
LLAEAGIDTKYARQHNYRSAFIRALRNLEEKRIIRRVEENGDMLVYQFTAEEKEGEGQDASLEYNKETVIVVDKEVYRRTGEFSRALVQGRDDIKQRVLQYFEEEKTKYYSSDITRYIQRIFADRADFINLRPQGCVYFVPARYRDTVEAVRLMLRKMDTGLSSLEAMPVVNCESSREVVGGAFKLEMQQIYVRIAAELKVALEGGKDVGEKWTENKRAELSDLLARVDDYGEVLSTAKKKEMTDAFEDLQNRLMPKRVLVDD